MGEGVPSWARVGQKVVCISAPWTMAPMPGFTNPTVGEVLSISDTVFNDRRQAWGLSFKQKHFHDIYNVRNFRPLVTRSQEQDVSRFRKHLRTKRTRTDAFVKNPHGGEIS